MRKGPKKQKQKQKQEEKEKQLVELNAQEAPVVIEGNGGLWVKMKVGELIASGYRFYPTDAELVFFLKNKILKRPVPHNDIISVNLYKFTPQQITEKHPGNGDNEWYFFAPRYREYSMENRTIRMAIDGYWKVVGSRKVIYNEGKKVGFKRALNFHGGSEKHEEVEFKWRMLEYILDQKRVPSTIQDPDDAEFNDWVICKIYKKTADVKIKKPIDEAQSNEEDPLVNIVFEMINCLDLLHSAFGHLLDCDTADGDSVQEQTEKHEPDPLEKRS